jgi:hypothetical protein
MPRIETATKEMVAGDLLAKKDPAAAIGAYRNAIDYSNNSPSCGLRFRKDAAKKMIRCADVLAERDLATATLARCYVVNFIRGEKRLYKKVLTTLVRDIDALSKHLYPCAAFEAYACVMNNVRYDSLLLKGIQRKGFEHALTKMLELVPHAKRTDSFKYAIPSYDAKNYG